MKGFFRQLQSVVDIDEDDEATEIALEGEMHDLPNDLTELKGRLIDALGRVRTASERWEKLHSESCAIESELAALRLRYKTSRDQWLLVHQFDQDTIDALLEEGFAARAGDPDAPDAVFVASLRKQNETLRELLRKYGEDRDRVKLKELKEQSQLQAVADSEPVADLAALEAELSRQAESFAVLARERREASSAADVQRIAQLERELEALRRGARAGEAFQLECAASNSPAAVSPAQLKPTAGEEGEDNAELVVQREAQLAAALEESAAREDALHALYRDVRVLRERNAELDAQLAEAGENAALIAREAAAVREECLAERQRADEWRGAAERAQQERQRAGRELAAVADELRRSRWDAAMRPAPTAKSGTHPSQSSPSSLSLPLPPGPSAAHALPAAQGLTVMAQGAMREWAHVLGRRRRAVLAAVVVIVLLTLIFAHVGGGASDHEMVSLRLQEDLRVCRLRLQAAAAPQV